MQVRQIKQPWFILLTHAFVAWITIRFYQGILLSNQVDHDTIDLYELYGFFVVILLLVLSIWTVIRRKKIAQWFLGGSFFILNVGLFFFGLNKIHDLPYQQRFVLRNDTPYSLNNLKIVGDTIIDIGTVQPKQKVKAIYSNFFENSSIDLTCDLAHTKDTVNLTRGLTNSVGKMYEVSIKVKNNKLKIDITQ